MSGCVVGTTIGAAMVAVTGWPVEGRVLGTLERTGSNTVLPALRSTGVVVVTGWAVVAEDGVAVVVDGVLDVDGRCVAAATSAALAGVALEASSAARASRMASPNGIRTPSR